MADILRVPSSRVLRTMTTDSLTTNKTNYSTFPEVYTTYDHGYPTSMIETPFNYIISGYKYTKDTLAPVKDGYFGLLADPVLFLRGASATLSIESEYPYSSLAGSTYNGHVVHSNYLGYWCIGSFNYYSFDGFYNISGFSSKAKKVYVNPCDVLTRRFLRGVISKRVKPLPYIRDNNNSNIIYSLSTSTTCYTALKTKVYSDPDITVSLYANTDNKQTVFNTPRLSLLKLDNTLQVTVWKQTWEQSLFNINYSDWEYLYQTQSALIFLGICSFDGSYLSIVSVNKDTGDSSELTRFSLFDTAFMIKEGTLTFDKLTNIVYRNLGFISSNEILLDVMQSYYLGNAYNAVPYLPKAQSAGYISDRTSRLVKFLLKYNTTTNLFSILWKNADEFIPPVIEMPSTGSSYSDTSNIRLYRVPYIQQVTGTLISSELNNSVITVIPTYHPSYVSSLSPSYGLSADILKQLTFNADFSKVIAENYLKVYNAVSTENKILPFFNHKESQFFGSSNPETFNPVKYPNNKAAQINTVPSASNSIYSNFQSIGGYVSSSYDDTYFAINKHAADVYMVWYPYSSNSGTSSDINKGLFSTYKAYELIKTSRKKQIFKLNEMQFYGTATQTETKYTSIGMDLIPSLPSNMYDTSPGVSNIGYNGNGLPYGSSENSYGRNFSMHAWTEYNNQDYPYLQSYGKYTQYNGVNIAPGDSSRTVGKFRFYPYGIDIICSNVKNINVGFNIGTSASNYDLNFLNNTTTPLTVRNTDHYLGYANQKATASSFMCNIPVSLTFKRSDPDPVKSLTLLNYAPMGIDAVSYMICVEKTFSTSYFPVSWVVEAHDIETNTWIELDRKEDYNLESTGIRNPGISINTNSIYNTLSVNNYTYYLPSVSVFMIFMQRYVNYFKLTDFKVKCPKGAYALRITFTKAASGNTVSWYKVMFQESTFNKWCPVYVPNKYYISENQDSYISLTDTGSNYIGYSFTYSNYTNSGGNFFSLLTPRIQYSIDYYNTNNSALLVQLSDKNSIPCLSIYDPNRRLTTASNYSNTWDMTFNYGPLGVKFDGIQFQEGWRHESFSIKNFVIEGSLNNVDWDTLVTSNPNLHSYTGDASSYEFGMGKLYLFTFPETKTYRYIRYRIVPGTSSNPHWVGTHTFNNSSTYNASSNNSLNCYIIRQFSLFRKSILDLPDTAGDIGNLIYVKSGYSPSVNPKGPVPMFTTYVTREPFNSSTESIYTVGKGGNYSYISTIHSTGTYISTAGDYQYFPHPTSLTSYNTSYKVAPDTTSDAISADYPYIIYLVSESVSGDSGSSIDGNYAIADIFPNINLSTSVVSKYIYAEKHKFYGYTFKMSTALLDLSTISGIPLKWRLEASNDMSTWVTVDTQTLTASSWKGADNLVREFKIANPDWYKIYRMVFTECIGNSQFVLYSDLTFYAEALETALQSGARPMTPIIKNIEGAVSLEKGVIMDGNINQYTNRIAYDKAFKIEIDSSTSSVVFKYDYQNTIEVTELKFRFCSSSHIKDLPTSISVYTTEDNITYTKSYTNATLEWEQEGKHPYDLRITLETPLSSRYFKVEFKFATLETDETLEEYWLMMNSSRFHPSYYTQQPYDNLNRDISRHLLYKLESNKWVTMVDCDFKDFYSIFWHEDNEFMRVSRYNIYHYKVNPITQTIDNVRITNFGGYQLDGAVLDSGKNIWYWTTVSPAVLSNVNSTESFSYYSCLGLTSQLTETKVKVKFTEPFIKLDSGAKASSVKVWVEDSKGAKVAGTVKLTITGATGKFTSTNSATITVAPTADTVVSVPLEVSTPGVVKVQAVLQR